MSKKPIVIAGGGPVGMTAAVILAQNDIPVILLEKNASPSREWRASTIHAGTLELLESTGLVEELLKLGIPAPKVQYRDRTNGLFAEFDFALIKDQTKYPYRLQLPQCDYVQIFNQFLNKCPIAEVRYSAEVISHEQDANGVNVTIKTPEGIETLRTPYFLAAEGAKSVTRKQLGIEFPGYTLVERFLLIGTPVSFTNYLPDLGYVNYISDPEEFLFILKVPQAWRILYPIPSGVSDEEAMNPERIQRTIQKALTTKDRFPIIETAIYMVHQRVAERYFEGRVILLGDAAHLNSPMGGLGLNNGVHDAVDLSRRMVRILNQGADAQPELQKYSDVRRKVAIDYVRQITERNTNVLTEKDPQKRLALQKEYSDQANDPVEASKWILRSAMISSVREQGVGEPPQGNANK